ncbi:hypothetical protein HAX54_017142 [Datura stramonium]|uniref:Uncharacterized protein n=1 Tax=Datura stramonium TaxID=4076 RepID=A0ABS8UK41_DATST|nr:hypothetical protein [Datura stramonium]
MARNICEEIKNGIAADEDDRDDSLEPREEELCNIDKRDTAWDREEVLCAALDQHDRILIEILRYERLMPEVSIRASVMREYIDSDVMEAYARHIIAGMIEFRLILVTTAVADISPWRQDHDSSSTCTAAETERQNSGLTVRQAGYMSNCICEFAGLILL